MFLNRIIPKKTNGGFGLGIIQHTDFKYLRRAERSIAQGYLTNSKSPDCLIRGSYPTHVKRAQDCELIMRNNDRFIDYICGLGTCLLGYNNSEVNQAAYNEMKNGMSYSLSSMIEVELAERFQGISPHLERIKFLKTSSEACTAALKIARNYTGRNYVLSEGYHGWHPEFTTLTPPSLGCPPSHYIYNLNEEEQINDQIAAVIIEPIQLDYSIERVKWLQDIRNRCTKNGVVLIFDETITGFRWRKWNVSNYSNITPDITILGKAIANGFPLSLVGGRAELMDDKGYFVSSTYAGENVSMAACLKVIDLIHNKKFNIDDLWIRGQDFIDRFNSLLPEKIALEGYPVRARFTGQQEYIWKFWEEAVKSHLIFGPSWFYNFKHAEKQNLVFDVIESIMKKIKDTDNTKIKGKNPCSPFVTKSRR